MGLITDELMEEAEARLSPARPAVKPTADPGTGLWVYCVAGGELPDLPPEVAGVAAGHAPQVLTGHAAGAKAGAGGSYLVDDNGLVFDLTGPSFHFAGAE